MSRREFLFVIEICLFSNFVVSSFGAQQKCDKTNCPGPLSYYNELHCKPIYKKPGECCAVKYDCSHLDKKSKTKCYVNGKEYELGEKLKEEDANPCDIGCTCTQGIEGTASFNCAVVDCFQPPPKPGCYRKNSPLDCCPGEEVCVKPEKRAKCVVGGKVYLDGEYFNVEGRPDLSCICQPGYEEKNEEPFCYTPKHSYCAIEMKHSYEIYQKCAPVYYSKQSPQTSCSVFSRCQNKNDTVIPNPVNREKSALGETDTCMFGNIKMQIGDELNQATDYSSVCVKCTCEVPPTPTCQRLPDDECDVTFHPPFHF